MRECLIIVRIAVFAREIFIYDHNQSSAHYEAANDGKKEKLILQLSDYKLFR